MTPTRILLGILATALGLAVHPAQAQSTLANGLVAYYPFDGNAQDQSGHANHGRLIGTTLAADRFGASNSGYHFNGAGDYIEIPSSPSLQFGQQLTVSAWVRPDQLLPPHNMCIVTKGIDVEGATDWAWAIDTDRLRPHLMLAQWRYWDSASIVRFNAWQHTTFTYDGATMRVYFDGVLQAQQSASGDFRISNGAMRIGAYSPINGIPLTGSKSFFSGHIDDVRVYNRALSSAEIADLHALESSEPCRSRRAIAAPNLVNGFLVGATITDPGCGYREPPVVLIRGSGTGATARATIADGRVTGITILNAGTGYSTDTRVVIASPPFTPSLEITVSRVKVTLHVFLGRSYVLESSTNLATWQREREPFLAEDEILTQEFEVGPTRRYFRIRETP